MSKMDALRAMREERYEQAQKAAGGRATTRRTAPVPVAPPAPAKATTRAATKKKSPAVVAETAGAVSEELCGHRNMGGRSCTRPAGHSEKSHRYG